MTENWRRHFSRIIRETERMIQEKDKAREPRE